MTDGKRIVDPYVPPEGWLPIETAPMDGTEIMICGQGSEGYYVATSVWNGEWNLFVPDDDAFTAACYNPSHWMPLPAPPSDAPAPTPLDPETAADNAALIAAIPRMISALEFARDGYARNDVSHEEYRVQVYGVVIDVLASIGRTL